MARGVCIQRLPGLTPEEEREQEEANRLRQAGATYSVPVPAPAAKPATLFDAGNVELSHTQYRCD